MDHKRQFNEASPEKLPFRACLEEAGEPAHKDTPPALSTPASAESLAQLRYSEQLYRSMFELASVGMAQVDMTGRYMLVNQKLCEILGYSREELLERDIQETTYPEDQDITRSVMKRLIAGELPAISTEKRYLRKDGTLIWVNLNTTLVCDADGKHLHFISIVEDISKRKQLEVQLLLSAEVSAAHASQLEATIEAIADGVMVYGADGHIIQANAAARALFAFDQIPEYLTAPFEQRAKALNLRDIEGKPLPLDKLPVSRVLRGDVLSSTNPFDVVFERMGSQRVELSVSGAPIRDARGMISGAVVIFYDVTERRRLQHRTQKSLHALLAMAETLVDSVKHANGALDNQDLAATGHKLVELTMSVLACRRAGLVSLDHKTGQLRPIAIVGLDKAFEQSLQESIWNTYIGEALTRQPLLRLYNNEVVDLTREQISRLDWSDYDISNLLIAPMQIGDQLIGLMGIEHEEPAHTYSADEISLIKGVAKLSALVIERERLLQESSEARANELALREANHRMDDFLSIASHELRTPLTAIKGNIQLAQRRIKNSVSPEKFAENRNTLKLLLERAEHQVGVQNRMVRDLLDVTRIQANRLELVFEPCDLVPIVREAVEDQRQVVAPRPIYLDLALEHYLVNADADRIGQVVNNYLTNALKYSLEEKPVWVRVETRDNQAFVSVRDEGPGLAPEEKERVWERFYRAKDVQVVSGNGSGLGMGLHICQTIIERHGGQVGVESQRGHGSTFWFSLPPLHESH